MSIIVNGRKIEWHENESVKDLLKRIKYTFPLVIVKINDKLILRSNYDKTIIPKKSKIDVIHMISGG
jgi:thiazole synthase/sulfur carrier protein